MSGAELRRYAAQLRNESATLSERASKAVRKAAFDTEADAKAHAPVDTGNLKNSIIVQMRGPLVAGVIATASYAPYVELGTSRMAPQPFMGPATDRNAGFFVEAMSRLGGGS